MSAKKGVWFRFLGGGEEAQHEMCVTWLTATRMSLVFVSIYVWMPVSL